MKFKLPLFAITLFTLFSCDELDKLTEFDVNENFGTTLNVDVPEDSPVTTWSQEITFDLTENEEIQENIDLIQNVKINTLSFEIANFEGAEDAKLTDVSLTVEGFVINLDDINLKASDDTDYVYYIDNAEQLQAIATYLLNKQTITATLSGTVSATPVNFDVVVDVEATITIDVI